MDGLVAYFSLFVAAFFAATIIPAQSEAILFGFLTAGTYSTVLLLLVASIGNVLGACVNWVLGRGVSQYRSRKWFPVRTEQLLQAETWYKNYGRWSLLFSWVPIIGDPITVAAGILREPFLVFFIFVTFAKTSRYLVIIALHQHWFG